MSRLAPLLALAACGGAAPEPPPPLASHVPAAPPAAALAPVVFDPPPADPACPLRWTELADQAPARIALRRGGAPADDDSCPGGFDPDALLVPGGCSGDDCVRAVMRDGTRAALAAIGPAGSGRFYALGLALDHGRFACLSASTVGWRYLAEVGDMLAPLPWLADLDRDGTAELIVWQRLPWGDAEVTNAVFPVVYELDGDALVRRDDHAHAIRARVAAAYRALARRSTSPDAPAACFRAVARALDAR